MFNGKLKAVTFSFDDGVTQDKRLIELFDKYNVKATFNINSELLGKDGQLIIDGKTVSHVKVKPEELKELYKNHEVAVHTLTHPNLTQCSEEEIIRQVEEDRKNLEKLSGQEVVGMAYPCGGVNNDDRVAEIIKNNTKIKYSRTITSTENFDLQNNFFRFNPSIHIYYPDKLFELGRKFIELKTDKPQIFYVWGHSYEFDYLENITWEIFEDFLKMIFGKDDIFYGTNKEILLAE